MPNQKLTVTLPNEANVIFNLGRITMREWREHVRLVTDPASDYFEKVDSKAALVLKTLAAYPGDWGTLQTVEDLLDLPEFDVWEPLVALFDRAVEDTQKKARSLSTTA